jgi:hypothetical protein
VLRIEKLEVPFEGGHGPKGAVSTISGWMDGWMVSRPTLGLIQPPTQRVQVLKWPRHATDQARLRIHSTLLCSLHRSYSWCFTE